MQRDYWYSNARKRSRVEDPVTVGRTAATRAVRRLGARKIRTVEVPVVFDPETAASLVRSIAGAASGPSLYRRASFLLDRLGTKIASPAVTIVDDALIGCGVNNVTGDYSRGAAGLWIEDGELAYPVEEVTVAGNLLEMFQAIDAVGDDLVLRDRTAAPTLMIGRMVVAGT